MDEKYKFDFLDFHRTQVIGKDGHAKTSADQTVYIPARLKSKMTELEQKCPNETLQMLFYKPKVKDIVDEQDTEVALVPDTPKPSQKAEVLDESKTKKRNKQPQDKGNRSTLTATAVMVQADKGASAWSDDSDAEGI